MSELTKEYLKLKLPDSEEYNRKYWEQVQSLNKKELEEMRIYLIVDNTSIVWFEERSENFSLPWCKFNEVDQMQKYYEIAQRILEIKRN